jgi:hypothetical protein
MPKAALSPICLELVTRAAVALVLLSLAQAQQRQALATHAAAPLGAQLVGRLPASQHMQLAISLPLRNQDQLNTFLQQLEDPTSPNYHHYLSPAQFTEQYGPTVEQYQQVIAFVTAHGFTVTHTSASRELLNITGPVSSIEQTFQLRMQLYQDPKQNRTYFAPSVDPTVDVGLPILGVSGLTNRVLPHPMLTKASPNSGPTSYQTGSGPGGQFLGSDFRAAYYGSGPLTGAGQAIALSELGQWNMADVTAYFNSVNQTLDIPIITELLGGTDGSCPGACDDGEEANDIIQITSMAPGASVLIVYEDTSGNADVDIFDAFATENIAKQMSWSFGIGPGNAVADEQQFARFHAQGQNFLVASGDEGANLGDGGWPGFSPDVTDVGGTNLTTASAGGPRSSETGWVGSGTGWCDSSNSSTPCFGSPGDSYDAIPSWQVASIISAAGGSTSYRDLPDVSADANTDSWWCAGGTCQGGLGGTSLAAPRWAGFLALVNEQAAANGDTSVSFLSPLAWQIGQSSSYDIAFYDVTSGCNPSGSTVPPGFTGQFCAMTGFDMVTGWGTPNSDGTINTMAPTSTTNPYVGLSASPAMLNLTPGGAPGTATISLTPGNGFTGTVDLSAVILGSPTGVTASFNPTSISGLQTSTLTVSTTSSAPAGTQMLVVSGTSSGVPTGTVFLTIGLPDFSLTVTPTNPPAYTGEPNSIYLNQGGSATATVAVSSQNGFGGSVDLAVSGQPTGVTATFNPTSTGTTSQLALAANSSATTGTDYLAVTGTSGTITGPLNAPYTILAVSAASGTGGSGTPVSLSSAYNLPAIYDDGITFGTGMDGAGFAYSANLLTPGSQVGRILNGVQFNLGPANAKNCAGSGQPACTNDAVSFNGQTINLPSGEFTTLQLLATAFDGPITGQTVTVTYADGTTSTFTQGFSDWCGCSTNPGGQSGESFAVVMPYRDEATGAEDNRVFNLYAYTFVLNSAKTVQSLTLPAKPSTGGVVIFAATLTSQNLGTQVSLSSSVNIAGLFNFGLTFEGTGDIDGPGTEDACTLKNGCTDAFWSGLPSGSGSGEGGLGLTATTSPTLTVKGLVFNLQNVNTADCGPSGGSLPVCINDIIQLPSAPGVTIDLPANQQTAYTTLTMLGSGVQGSHTGTVTVNYTTGSPSSFNQTFSDWCNFGNNTFESVAVGGMYRINSDGTLNTQATCNLYAYTYALDSSREVSSITLANTDGTTYTFSVALTLSGNTSTGPGFSLSGTGLSVVQGNTGTSTVTSTVSGGFNSAVALSASGQPSGVTISFNPASIGAPGSGTSTMTANVASTVAAGTYPITVTGTGGGLSETTTVTLTVTGPPSFSLSASATSLNVGAGASDAEIITIDPANGFESNVTLAVTSTLPTGVTASFSPNPTTTSSTLSLTASSSAAIGSATVTVTGTSGSLTETTTFSLNVTGSFSLGATPASGSVTAGNSLTSTIAITPSSSYSGSVTLSCSISPAVSGMTAPTCSFGSTSPVTVTNGAPASAMLTFTTVSPSPMIVHTALFGDANTLSPRGPSPPENSRANLLYGLIWMPVSGLVLVGFKLSGRKATKRKWSLLLMLWLLTGAMVILPACGSGSSTPPSCTSGPTAPTALAASGTTSTGTALNWTASSATSPCTVTSYAIYQNGTKVATTTNTTYNVTGLVSGNQYSFTVAATDSNGTSAQSSPVSVSTGTQAQTYTLTITGTGSGSAAQIGNPSTVTVTVTQ